MNRAQLLSIALALGIFSLLYFGFDTKPSKQKELEKTRSFSAELTSGEALIKSAKAEMTAEQLGELELLEVQSRSDDEAQRLTYQKQLASRWYQMGHPDISGYYALKIAEKENTEAAWSIAGTTFSLCLNNSPSPDREDFCKKRAISSFENAISIAPDNPQHRVNLAMVYANHPLPEQPMKGIQMLLELNRNDPDNVLVLKTLANFGLQTNQFDKVIGRLERAKALAPADQEVDCLLEKAYLGKGLTDKAQVHGKLCADRNS